MRSTNAAISAFSERSPHMRSAKRIDRPLTTVLMGYQGADADD
jgi:hypothetical protein